MSGGAMNKRDEFAEQVMSCALDISPRVAAMVPRFDDMVLVSALVHHVGGALQLLMQRNLCDAQQARRVLHRIEITAFHQGPNS